MRWRVVPTQASWARSSPSSSTVSSTATRRPRPSTRGWSRTRETSSLEKPHFGAFHDTALETELRSRGVDTIVISGIETNVCCETTAREAMVRDFRVFFLSDGTTTAGVPGLSRDEVQRASLATVGQFFAEVVTVNDMAERIQAAAAG